MKRIERKAIKHVAQKNGVSHRYLREIFKNKQRMESGQISHEEWERRALAIAYRYPNDSGFTKFLQEQKFKQQSS